ELVAAGDLDVAEALAVGVEYPVHRRPVGDFPAHAGVGAIDVRHLRLQLEAIGDAATHGQRGDKGIALDLAYVDQADEDGRDHRVPDQRDAVAGRIAVLERWLQDP